ncbi:hypothetical protein ABZ816_07925 [Actinosynnema sp. NPDC047251]|uniref:Uncharacterized protein n=1 Tax=Saccharothrix espanaensis (strain ATCC 51144 / DSM 44229 / JCM 9112 / NBRC 15066 / NRRL 15764) TaxID=1179773 RepID=K0JQZ9_SACES|nr:hypothetical protein [Saccharothrix espanaensis]CCH27612.1 hypothetical protein BN6_02800 [Saccharothrix espanaensis DSM 44229]
MTGIDVDRLAPQLFAVVQQDDEEDWVAAWGMAFEDHAEVASTSGDLRMLTATAESALRYFEEGDEVRTTIVWVTPAAPRASALL